MGNALLSTFVTIRLPHQKETFAPRGIDMQKTLLTTTALVALVSVTAMAEEFDVSGETSLEASKEGTSAEYDFSLGKSFTTDNNHVLGGQLDVKNDGPYPFVYWESDAGKLTIGHHDGPARTMSLGSDLRGTIPAAGEANTSVFQDASTPRVSFQTPSVAGFVFGASASSQSEQQYGVNYTLPIGEATIKLGHSRSTVGKSGNFLGGSTEETGAEFKMGKFTASFVNFAKSETNRFGYTVSNRVLHQWSGDTAGNVPGTSQSTAYWHSFYNPITDTFVDEINTGRVLTNNDLAAFNEGCTAVFYVGEREDVVKVRDYSGCSSEIQTEYGVSHLAVKDAYEAMCGAEFCGIYTGIATNNRYTTDSQVLVLNDDGTVSQIDTSNTVFVPGGVPSQDGTGIEAVEYVPMSTDVTSETTGQELEIAYQFTDKVIGNAVKYRTDQGYDRLSVGVGYQINDDMSASISQSSINDNGVKDTAYLARLTYSF